MSVQVSFLLFNQTVNVSHPQNTPDVDEFVSSSGLEKCVSASVSHQWMLCSEWVPSEWESDKNITITHTTPVHQFMSCEVKNCVFIRNKSLIFKTVWLSWIVNSAWSFSPENAILWIDLYFIQEQSFEVQNALCMMYLFIANMQLVDYCDVFISCLDSHSDGTHSLQSIYWWASDETIYLFWPVLGHIAFVIADESPSNMNAVLRSLSVNYGSVY